MKILLKDFLFPICVIVLSLAMLLGSKKRSTDAWFEIPVFICVDEQDNSHCLNGGKIKAKIEGGVCVDFFYENLEGKQYSRDWNGLVATLERLKNEQIKKMPQKAAR
jgi:hypothetical protein